MVKDHSDSTSWVTLSNHMHHPKDRIAHTTAFAIPVVDNKPAGWDNKNMLSALLQKKKKKVGVFFVCFFNLHIKFKQYGMITLVMLASPNGTVAKSSANAMVENGFVLAPTQSWLLKTQWLSSSFSLTMNKLTSQFKSVRFNVHIQSKMLKHMPVMGT